VVTGEKRQEEASKQKEALIKEVHLTPPLASPTKRACIDLESVVLVEKDLRGDSIMKEHLNAAILAVAILLAATIYCLFPWKNGRYQIVKLKEADTPAPMAYEVDTRTGDVWILFLKEGAKKMKYTEVFRSKFEFVSPENLLEQKPKEKP
jgi:hypothetical protein